MNKLVNLIILFLTLQYLIPSLVPLIRFDSLQTNKLYMNLFTAGVIGLMQFTFNIGMIVSKRKDLTMKDILIDALFKSIIVLGGFQILQDIESNDNSLSVELRSNKLFESIFITIIITFFILIKCLITP
jgi:flagellar biosynthesis regulator FlaF